MKQLLLLLPALAALACLSGCMMMGPYSSPRAPVMVPPGYVYQHTRAPISYNFDRTAASTKTGEASVTHLHLWPISLGLSFSWMEDKVLNEAIKKADIKTLNYADYELFNVLGVYTRFTVFAYGD